MQPFLALSTLLFFCILSTSAQNKTTFGKLTTAEKSMSIYEKDPSAHAVVLYEKGNNYFKVVNRHIRLIKEYHVKIKILDEKGFDQGTVEIPLYHNNALAEKVTSLKAVTHNDNTQYNVLPSEIFENDHSERWRVKTFTFPKMQKGSILEYSYTITTPYDFNFNGWDFQGSIPKIYSEFNAKIPGNWVYNRSLRGNLELDVNDAHIQKGCFTIDGYPKAADCEVLKYTMKDIPAFKEDGDFMLSAENYRSRLDFELSQYNRLDGTTNKYTKSWKDVDREFRSDKDIGRQLAKKGFFERHVPEKLLIEGDELTRAKNIFEFVQEHFTWNEQYSSYGKARVKEAFEAQKGNAWEINMSLINLLNAADIPTNLMLLSTRKRGLPTKMHPVMSNFNYVVGKTEIGGKSYLLDATDKYMPFGFLPFRALNHYGRVMDFKNDSYWYDIKPQTRNRYQVRAQIKFDPDENKALGVFDAVSMGYNAVDMHKTLSEKSEEEYLDSVEEDIPGNFAITSYELVKQRTDKQMVSQRFKFEIEDVLNGDMAYVNPFFIRFFNKNPFQLEERNYPIDFGYPRSYRYQIILTIPDGYVIQELPENKSIALGDTMATLKFYSTGNASQISFSFELALNGSYFTEKDYNALKALFKEAVDLQKNSLVVFKKKTAQP
ncbi:DUF3857 and transglutaminase domain-containing protein [Ulvibacterium marinum]|uniref:DUF3857 and transglutaminase domain-containing protein n=1 Tax=Ulvibacterium marinum TaxID=2419782 RepID=UPI0024944348|nr:DUF3857 and transglutaminase domain-containing protein [Ulvibacterium marinum]